MTVTVCIIDDDELARADMGRKLAADGFTVIQADTAKRGLAMIAELAPDILLVDLIMPDRDGLETIAEVRRRWPDLRIVAISGGGRVGPSLYLDLARNLGATGCLSKPLDITLFRQAIGG